MDSMATMTKQQAIAEKLNVSVTTVSKALRGYPDISKEMRGKVKKTAKEMGYRESRPRAKKTPSLQAKFLGIVIYGEPSEHRSITTRYFKGISELAHEENLSPVFYCYNDVTAPDILEPSTQPILLRDNLLEGLIFIHQFPRDIAKQLSEKASCVSIVHNHKCSEIARIDFDRTAGAELLVNHLKDLGHRKIGFFSADPELTWSVYAYSGFCAAMTQAGLEFNPKWHINHCHHFKPGQQIVLKHDTVNAIKSAIDEGVTAWCCSADAFAAYMQQQLTELGYDVPGDISITGFHREEPNSYPMQFTSLTCSPEELGKNAVKALMAKVEHRETHDILLRANLCVYESTGPVNLAKSPRQPLN